MKIFYRVSITIIILMLLAGAGVYYFIFTDKGSAFIVQYALSKYANAKRVVVERSEGCLGRTMVLHNVEIDDLEILRHSNIVRIQRFEFTVRSLGLGGIDVTVYNGRAQLPSSELVVFLGCFKKGILDFNIYSKSLSAERFAAFFPEIREVKDISGAISGIDIFVKGTVSEPIVSGQCRIEKLTRSDITLSDCPVSFNVRLREMDKEPKLDGVISLNKGTIFGSKTARIALKESKISIAGDLKQAALDLKGAAEVEGTKIDIALKGAFDKPDLKLTSDPPFSQDRLLIMLVTGKSWSATETALGKGEFSPGLAKDFLDYFVFSGSGSKIGEKLGISDISVTYDGQKQGVGVKKSVTEKVDVTYSYEQSQLKNETQTITQSIGGEYKVTDSVSVGAEKELKQENNPDASSPEQKANDKVMIKFKKTF
ncbi:MAG: translocation/assembly module TamB domain-containing protein [Candidatus Omnitrophota bacterium]